MTTALERMAQAAYEARAKFPLPGSSWVKWSDLPPSWIDEQVRGMSAALGAVRDLPEPIWRSLAEPFGFDPEDAALRQKDWAETIDAILNEQAP